MGLLGNLKTTAAWAGSHGASRFSKAARLGKRAKVASAATGLPRRVPGANLGSFEHARAPRKTPIKVSRTKNIHGNYAWMHDEYKRMREGSRAGKAMSIMGNPTGYRVMRPPPPSAINKKGMSGFSHGKKLMYGAAGVGAAGLAWGMMQRNHSTDKTGYSQSRGIRNY